MSSGLWFLPMDREQVEHPSDAERQEVASFVESFAAELIKNPQAARIILTISGHGRDRRELFEVPEVCAWARDIIKHVPSLPFFIDDASRAALAGWLLGPTTRKEARSGEFRARAQRSAVLLARDALPAAHDILRGAGATEEQVTACMLAFVGGIVGIEA